MSEQFDVECLCGFCGHTYRQLWPRNVQGLTFPGCEKCTVYNARQDAKVRYAAWNRDPAEAIFADRHLVRGKVYTVAKVRRWQHGGFFFLKEVPGYAFSTRLFTPVKFQVSTDLTLDS